MKSTPDTGGSHERSNAESDDPRRRLGRGGVARRHRAPRGILADDFVGVGPRGFTLTKDQWLSRHEAGSLRYEAFGLDEVQVRLFGDAAITVCRQSARGVYEGENGRFELDDQFRATLVFIRQDGRWQLANLQLSPILGRP